MSYLFTIFATLFVVLYIKGMMWAYQKTIDVTPMTNTQRLRIIALWPTLWFSSVFSNLQ